MVINWDNENLFMDNLMVCHFLAFEQGNTLVVDWMPIWIVPKLAFWTGFDSNKFVQYLEEFGFKIAAYNKINSGVTRIDFKKSKAPKIELTETSLKNTPIFEKSI